jgi:hypothetical protein
MIMESGKITIGSGSSRRGMAGGVIGQCPINGSQESIAQDVEILSTMACTSVDAALLEWFRPRYRRSIGPTVNVSIAPN